MFALNQKEGANLPIVFHVSAGKSLTSVDI